MVRVIKVKPEVQLQPKHFTDTSIAAIIKAADVCFPQGYELVITRGMEQVPGGKERSKHLIGQALDFRTKHLDEEISREQIAHRMQQGLGPRYYVYFGLRVVNNTSIEWIHAQYND